MYNYLVLIFWPRMYAERTNHFRIKIILYISTQGSHYKCCICQELFVLQSRVRQNAILKTYLHQCGNCGNEKPAL